MSVSPHRAHAGLMGSLDRLRARRRSALMGSGSDRSVIVWTNVQARFKSVEHVVEVINHIVNHSDVAGE